MIVVIDNYDSFTYNLVQYLGELADEVAVFRNDRTTVADVLARAPAAVVISPGPCTPTEAGISTPLITALAGRVPVLGVCLGHQCIGAAFGGRVIRGRAPVHGKVSEIHHDGKTIYEGLPNPLVGTRYHSLIIDRETIPDVLEVSAELSDGTIMGVRHKAVLVEGVQFHPESVLTAAGKDLLRNFLRLAGVSLTQREGVAVGPMSGTARP
ncbi:MAG TPA: aminodeoxychorismate/anthranilate synthase component II [bacterium]|jgi:anthranilate synthase/aminodeoxychorismate synthase-like glutamine amidotransferase